MWKKTFLRKKVKEKVGQVKDKTLKRIAGAYAVGMCTLLYTFPVFASNPVAQARTVANEWLQPLFFIGISVFGVLLLLKRKFTELFAFLAVALIACALIFFPENIKNFLGDIVTRLFP